MSLELENKVAIVTGGSRGIGRVIAETLGAHGAKIVINSTAVSKNQAEDTLASLKSNGVEAIWVVGDISQPETGDNLVDQAKQMFGHLDILVNNAGINKDTFLVRMSDEQWDQVIRTNLTGSMLVTRPAIKEMMRQRSGSIVFISSIAAHGNPGQANYAASKGGIEGLMKTMALEYAGRGIRANAVAGGPIDTGMLSVMMEEQRDAFKRMVPLGRLITPQEIANTVLFLASGMSSGITGQVINVDGGMVR